MLLVDLPTEVLLQALSHLPIQDIHTFKAINRSCKDVVGENEGSIYHAAAILHGFVTESTSLQKATHNETWLNGVSNWKAFCRRHFALEARWKGQNILPKNGLKVGRSKTAGLNAHRLKIDEGEGTIIVSRAEGGLRVVSIDTDELLWELKADYVSAFSHVEWSNGFLAFTGPRNTTEIWRRSLDAWDPEKYLPCNPHPNQRAAVSLHAPTAPPSSESANPGRRGVYVPYALFVSPSPCRVSRLAYPDFVTASAISRKAYIWDIPSCRQSETLAITPHGVDGSSTNAVNLIEEFIYYVEIDKDHVFICWGGAMVAYPRRQNRKNASHGSFSISNRGITRPKGITGASWKEFPYFELSQAWDHPTSTSGLPLQTPAPSRQLVPGHAPSNFFLEHDAELIAVHVSPDGKDLVATTSYPSWLIYVKDFQNPPKRGYDDTKSFRTFLKVDRMIYLAFDGRRIVVGTAGGDADQNIISSVYVVTLDDRRHVSDNKEPAPLRPTIVSLESLWEGIDYSSCIQLTKTRVWMTYPHGGSIVSPADNLPDDDPTQLCITYVDMNKVEKLSVSAPKRARRRH